jgi:DNA-directed RNA polymerase specialized sigma24 family protein
MEGIVIARQPVGVNRRGRGLGQSGSGHPLDESTAARPSGTYCLVIPRFIISAQRTGIGREGVVVTPEGSITDCLGRLKAGDQAAAQRLWEAYAQRLIGLARARLRHLPRRIADEEDIALSAFDSFCRRAGRGQFPRLDDRGDLWQLLVVLTLRKVVDLARYERRQSRGAGRVLSLADLAEHGLQDIPDSAPTPELAAEVAEECRRLLEILDDETLRSVAIWKLEGYTNHEIAAKLECVDQTVERKLRTIRSIWAREAQA